MPRFLALCGCAAVGAACAVACSRPAAAPPEAAAKMAAAVQAALPADLGYPAPKPAFVALAVPASSEGLDAEFANTPAAGTLGGPRAGLSDAELRDFVRGRVLFEHGPGEAGGLGPTYVKKSCFGCHTGPVMGGEGDMKEPLLLVAKPGEDDVLIHQPNAIAGVAKKTVPAGALTSKRRAPMLFGVGVIDQIAPEEIAKRADPADADGDGVRGKANSRSGQLARWGLKAHDLTLHRVIVGSLYEDLGLTCQEFEPMRADADAVPDPEAGAEVIRLYEAYIGNLAQPPRGAVSEEAAKGEKVFEKAGCAACHVRDLGPAKGIYSDLLLHDLGPDNGDGLSDALAKGNDWRTAPLWGLRYRQAMHHDHRAKTFAESIGLHKGEGDRSRQAVLGLTETERVQLYRFLASL